MIKSTNLELIQLFLIVITSITCILTNFGFYTFYYISIVFAVFAVGLRNFTNIKMKKKLFYIIVWSIVVGFFSIMQSNFTDIFKFMLWFLAAVLGFFTFSKMNASNRYKIGCTFIVIIILSSVEGLIQLVTKNITFAAYLNSWGDNLRQGTVSFYLQHIVWGHILVLGIVLNEFINEDRIYVKNGLRVLFFINLYACRSRTSWIAVLIFLMIIFYKNYW